MKPRNIFLSSIALAALVILSFAALIPAVNANETKAKKATECEKQAAKFLAKHGKDVNAFAVRFSKKFDADAAYMAIGLIRPGQVADAAEAEKLVRSKFQKLSPDQRREVWLAKFNRLSEDDFTPAQWAFIQRQKETVKGLKFDGTDDANAVGEEIKSGKDLFGRRQLYHLFGSLKPASGDVEVGKTKGSAQDGAIFQKASMTTAQTVYCNCSYFDWDDFCSWWYGQGSHCVTSSQSGCTHTAPCGWLLTGVCNGLCRN
jgi:hypothetical protein